jgi:hypothetical protein
MSRKRELHFSVSPSLQVSKSPGLSEAGAAAHPIMFWVLTTLAFAVFAPCVLVPIWIEVEQAAQYEAGMAQAVSDLDAQAQRNETRIQALLADPLVNERIARRELNYLPVGEQVTRWSADELAGTHASIPEPDFGGKTAESEQTPNWAKSMLRWLPAWPWREMFANQTNRSLLLMMAGGLIGTAFLLYGRKPIFNSTQ